MGISAFAVHNVLRTYSRQERLGQAQRPAPRAPQRTSAPDQVSLSPAAQKTQLLGHLAAEIVDLRFPGAPPEERSTRIRSTKEGLLARHRDEVADEGLTSEQMEKELRPLYLG